MSEPARRPSTLPASTIESAMPVAPSAEAWRALSPAARARFVEEARSALQAAAELMAEGSPHFRSKMRARLMLGDYFRRAGKDVYLACELPVYYPEEPVFCPDLMAVVGVPDPGDQDERLAWSVVDEERGVDFVLEILHHGDPTKDLVRNVSTYARLGIPEYFIYDMRQHRILGYRLDSRGPRHYRSIPSSSGRVRSEQLGLDITVEDRRIQFYAPGGALVLETNDLLERLSKLAEQIERRAQLAEGELARERARADTEAATRLELELLVAELRARLGGGETPESR